MVGNRKSFSKITAILLNIFGLVGFNNDIDSRVYAMNQNEQNKEEEMELVVESDDSIFKDDGSVDMMKRGHVFKKKIKRNSVSNFDKSKIEENNNNDFDIDDIINNPTAESIIMNKKDDKNEKNGKDNTDDKKDGENEKWSTGKKVGVGSAIIAVVGAIIGGIIYLVNRLKKSNTPARGLQPQNLNHNSKSNANLNINNNLSNINNKPIVLNR